MPTIKRKVEMSLPQLIEWVKENEKFGQKFTSNNYNYGCVHVDDDGVMEFVGKFHGDTFTVEIEEEITEDTKLSKSLAIFEHNKNIRSEMHDNKSINNILRLDIKVKNSHTKTIYILNDDQTMDLIWRNGGLVE